MCCEAKTTHRYHSKNLLFRGLSFNTKRNYLFFILVCNKMHTPFIHFILKRVLWLYKNFNIAFLGFDHQRRQLDIFLERWLSSFFICGIFVKQYFKFGMRNSRQHELSHLNSVRTCFHCKAHILTILIKANITLRINKLRLCGSLYETYTFQMSSKHLYKLKKKSYSCFTYHSNDMLR